MEPLIPESRAIDIAKKVAREKDEHFASTSVVSKSLNKGIWIIELRPEEAPLGILEFYIQVRLSARNGQVLNAIQYSNK